LLTSILVFQSAAVPGWALKNSCTASSPARIDSTLKQKK
jgi:hypothetical protein